MKHKAYQPNQLIKPVDTQDLSEKRRKLAQFLQTEKARRKLEAIEAAEAAQQEAVTEKYQGVWPTVLKSHARPFGPVMSFYVDEELENGD